MEMKTGWKLNYSSNQYLNHIFLVEMEPYNKRKRSRKNTLGAQRTLVQIRYSKHRSNDYALKGRERFTE